jgi:hypothetical protein
MDAAAAARMSDPDRNPHFRRRWTDRAVQGLAARTERPALNTAESIKAIERGSGRSRPTTRLPGGRDA